MVKHSTAHGAEKGVDGKNGGPYKPPLADEFFGSLRQPGTGFSEWFGSFYSSPVRASMSVPRNARICGPDDFGRLVHLRQN
jgi:hypothetical protein